MKKKLMAALFGISMGVAGFVSAAAAGPECDFSACSWRACQTGDLTPEMYLFCLDVCCGA